MKDIETGGPAFPNTDATIPKEGDYWNFQGMTLRDYFAAKAMQGMLAGGRTGADYVAGLAYQYADSMLKAREQ